ncbi:MAG TPA: hypothetical protein VGD43_05580 [Micromonospora sp.]
MEAPLPSLLDTISVVDLSDATRKILAAIPKSACVSADPLGG